MIKKNAIYGKSIEVTVAEFGFGTVHMNNSKMKDNSYGDVRFLTGEKKEINESFPADHEKEENFEIVFRFHNEESINAVINQLEDLKVFLNLP